MTRAGEPSADTVIAAQADRQIARQRLFASLDDAKARLHPATIAQDAIDGATDGAKAAARKGIAAVRARPVTAAAAAGGIGLFLARGWIARKLAECRAANETRDRPTSLTLRERRTSP